MGRGPQFWNYWFIVILFLEQARYTILVHGKTLTLYEYSGVFISLQTLDYELILVLINGNNLRNKKDRTIHFFTYG